MKKLVRFWVFTSLLIAVLVNSSWAQTIDVTIPDVSASNGSQILIPINVSELNVYSIYAFQFQVSFDNSVINAVGISNQNAITDAWLNDDYFNNTVAGQVTFGGFTTSAVSGNGVLVNLVFNVIGNEPDASDISFDNFMFNDGSVPVNLTNGSVTLVEGAADPVTDLTITHTGGTSVQLNWSATNQATSYNIYRGTTPYFTPDTPLATVTGTTFTDATGAGSAATNYYYLVKAVGGSVEADASNRVGEFDFELVTTATTDFNEIGLVMVLPGVDNASQLLAAIPNCNSVARWDASSQGYVQYIQGVPPTDFSVTDGYPYYVNITDNTTFTLAGDYSSPVFNLVTTPTTDFNEVILPLTKANLVNADNLLNDIPNCNSVARWDAASQGYVQYIQGVPPTNFDISVGYPYYVNLTAATTWPSGGLLKNSGDVNGSASQMAKAAKIHAVHGQVNLTEHKENSLTFNAYVKNRPTEVLTNTSPGSNLLDDGVFWVQCGGFSSDWAEGETLVIDFYVNENLWQQWEAELTYNPDDQAVLVKDVSTVSELSSLPTEFSIYQNYPNPFNGETILSFDLPHSQHINVEILNSLGQRVNSLYSGSLNAGKHRFTWNATTQEKQAVPSGVYFYKVSTQHNDVMGKMLLIR